MARYAVAGIIVIGLAVGILLLLPGDETSPTTTSPPFVEASTTTSTSTSVPTTTTTSGSHVVETVEEAEVILRELWFGWFEGIYNQDEDRIREVVATERMIDAAQDQFAAMEFVSRPTLDGLEFHQTEILRSDSECLALWVVVNAELILGQGGIGQGVDVLRRVNGQWLIASSWVSREDLWEADCDAVLS